MLPHAFTLVEFLVVIGTLIILLALILPALFNAKESGRAALCASNQHQVTLAFIQFSVDHQGCLPGNYFDYASNQPNFPWKRDFMLGDDPNHGNNMVQFLDGPQKGTIYPYLSNSPSVYRCPSYYVGAPIGSGVGSNGRFDYAAFLVFTGARVGSISPKARFHFSNTLIGGSIIGSGGAFDSSVFTPLVCEEDSGRINMTNVESGHSNFDQLGHVHFGGANYSSVDGSVHRFTEPAATGDAWNWEIIGPSGNWRSIGTPSVLFGWWNTQ
jgi:type II secretory pathway pseudopilin PulG